MGSDFSFSRDPGSGRGLLGAIVEELGLRILRGYYPADKTIPTEPELMAELNVSRTVLREAIKVLSAKGLLESRTKIGTIVRPSRQWNLLDPAILDLYKRTGNFSEFAKSFQQIRVIIEPEAAALAAEHRSARQLKVLEDAYQAMANAQDVHAWTDADLSFHEAILDATNNPFMHPLGSIISAALETLLFHSAQSSADPFDSLQVHGNVLDAIRKRDADAARRAMKKLLAGTSLSITKTVKASQRRSENRTFQNPR